MDIKYFFKYIRTKDVVNIKIKGLINFEVALYKVDLVEDKNNIWLICENKQRLGINKHQIIKIFLDKEKNIIIKLDQLLEVTIKFAKP